MKKSARNASKASRKSQRKAKAAPAAPEQPERRDVLKLMRNGTIGAVALGGLGWWGVSAVRATAAEQDLSRVGKGKPSIVQIHDPQCPMCTQLQRAARRALKSLDDDNLVYLVANIRGDEGRQFAARYNVPHVTLILFNGDGEVQQILNGVRSDDELMPLFQSLADSA